MLLLLLKHEQLLPQAHYRISCRILVVFFAEKIDPARHVGSRISSCGTRLSCGCKRRAREKERGVCVLGSYRKQSIGERVQIAPDGPELVLLSWLRQLDSAPYRWDRLDAEAVA